MAHRVHINMGTIGIDTLAEWLRRRPAKPMGSPCVGSNPTGVDMVDCPLAIHQPATSTRHGYTPRVTTRGARWGEGARGARRARASPIAPRPPPHVSHRASPIASRLASRLARSHGLWLHMLAWPDVGASPGCPWVKRNYLLALAVREFCGFHSSVGQSVRLLTSRSRVRASLGAFCHLLWLGGE